MFQEKDITIQSEPINEQNGRIETSEEEESDFSDSEEFASEVVTRLDEGPKDNQPISVNQQTKSTKCDDCGLECRKPSHLIRHKRIHMSGTFFSDPALKLNLRCIILYFSENDNGKRPYKCKDCGKGFSLIGNLRRHEKTHLGMNFSPIFSKYAL